MHGPQVSELGCQAVDQNVSAGIGPKPARPRAIGGIGIGNVKRAMISTRWQFVIHIVDSLRGLVIPLPNLRSDRLAAKRDAILPNRLLSRPERHLTCALLNHDAGNVLLCRL